MKRVSLGLLPGLWLAALLMGYGAPALGASVERRPVDIWSDGTRLAGDLWLPEQVAEGERRPAVLMTHGWGGVRDHLNTDYAPAFARAGFVTLTFDYRGWGDSDSRLVVVGDEPAPDGDGIVTVRARAIREVVDPIAQIRDIVSAIDYLSGEPSVDPDRIGLWGTSYSGGHVIVVGTQDARVRAIVAQVGYMGVSKNPRRALAQRRAIQKARGEIDPIPQDLDCIPRLRGCPDLAKMLDYRPVAVADRITVPTLVIDAEAEELFDRHKNGRAVYDIVKERVPADYVLYSGAHYAIYGPHRGASIERAVAWFTTHLAATE
ncbi:MAG: CocE/NonD family hydrolase [Alphaproteobacteria bacterium]|jgi:hypothetical protein|nr:CocE/NonD family hydrolase [Alphaproteobacteria bacterium]